jgi:hypothetical protein
MQSDIICDIEFKIEVPSEVERIIMIIGLKTNRMDNDSLDMLSDVMNLILTTC